MEFFVFTNYMSKKGPIVIIEDDKDDKEIFVEIIRDLGYTNEVEWFDDAKSAFNYLCTTEESPFLIFSDINLPGSTGLELKRTIDQTPELRRKSIPFVFFSTTTSQEDVNYAYLHMTVQGFFKKGNNFSEMRTLIKTIFDYWSACKHPNMD